MNDRPLRFGTYLAPSVYSVYKMVADRVGRELGCATELVVGESYSQFADGDVDVGFICGLPYVHLMRQQPPPVELLAAPVLHGERYGGRPIYYSDVIVGIASPLRSFADLRGRTWSYNEPASHSGYGVTRYRLVQMAETRGYFGKVIEAGWHQKSITMVAEGEVDGSAIDSQVLEVALVDDPALAERVRIIESFGPSTIQPVVAASRLPDSLKADIQGLLVGLADDPEAQKVLKSRLVERFVPINDAAYDDIREMLAAAEAAGFLTLA